MAKENKRVVNGNDFKSLKVLFTIVNRSKATYYVDLLEQFEINMQMVLYGIGTANSEIRDYLKLNEVEKAVIISIVREDKVKDICNTLTEKFSKIKDGKGIAYTIPVKRIIGVSIYQFLSNNKTKWGE